MRMTRVLCWFSLASLMAGVVFAQVNVRYERESGFYQYKTFMWLASPRAADPYTGQRMMAVINSQLQARGLRLVSSGADLGVRASATTRRVPTLTTYRDGFNGWIWGPGWGWSPNWGWGSPGWVTATVDLSLEGVTVVDLIDVNSGKTVWRGESRSPISDKPEEAMSRRAVEIGRMFEEFPRLN